MVRGTRKLVTLNTKEIYENGEFVRNEAEVNTSQKSVEPDYVKIYLDNVLMLKNVSPSRNPILYQLLKFMPYAHSEQIIILNSYLKKKIASRLNISVKYIEKAITEFVKANIFFRLGLGTYQVNPMIFGKGTWEDISKLRMQMSYMDSSTGVEEKIDFANIVNDEVASTTEEE